MGCLAARLWGEMFSWGKASTSSDAEASVLWAGWPTELCRVLDSDHFFWPLHCPRYISILQMHVGFEHHPKQNTFADKGLHAVSFLWCAMACSTCRPAPRAALTGCHGTIARLPLLVSCWAARYCFLHAPEAEAGHPYWPYCLPNLERTFHTRSTDNPTISVLFSSVGKSM